MLIYQEAARVNWEPIGLSTLAPLPQQPRLGGDESPTKQAQAKAWVWTFVAVNFTVFGVRCPRAATVLKEFLGPFRGIISCDRAKMYWRLGWEAEVPEAIV